MEQLKDVVVYDGECPFCCRQIERIRQRDRLGCFEYVPRQQAGLIDRFPALAVADFNTGMRLIERNGTVRVGADAVYHIARRLPCWRRWTWLYRLPGLHALAKRVYAWIAANRQRLGQSCDQGACKLPAQGARTYACFFCQRPHTEVGPLVQSESDVYICRDCAARSQAVLEQGEGLRTKDAACSFCKQAASEAIGLVEASNHLAFICLGCARICQSTIDQQRERRAKFQFSLGQLVALVLVCGTALGLLRWSYPEDFGLNPVLDMILVFGVSALAVWHRETRLAIVALAGAACASGGGWLPASFLSKADWLTEVSDHWLVAGSGLVGASLALLAYGILTNAWRLIARAVASSRHSVVTAVTGSESSAAPESRKWWE